MRQGGLETTRFQRSSCAKGSLSNFQPAFCVHVNRPSKKRILASVLAFKTGIRVVLSVFHFTCVSSRWHRDGRGDRHHVQFSSYTICLIRSLSRRATCMQSLHFTGPTADLTWSRALRIAKRPCVSSRRQGN